MDFLSYFKNIHLCPNFTKKIWILWLVTPLLTNSPYGPKKPRGFNTGTVKVWDEGIENNLQRKLINAPCLQYKDVNWIEVRPNFHRRNLSFCLGLHNCHPIVLFFNTTFCWAAPRIPSRGSILYDQIFACSCAMNNVNFHHIPHFWK